MNIKKKSRAQASFEYLMIFTFALIILIPTTYLVQKQSRDSGVQIAAERAKSIGLQILENVAYIYTVGRGSKTSLDFTFPEGIQNMTVTTSGGSLTGTELVLHMRSDGQDYALVFFSRHQMFIGNCTHVKDLPESFVTRTGRKALVVTSCGQNISLYSPE
jgi:uncharacterized protein (UPF0333 family)